MIRYKLISKGVNVYKDGRTFRSRKYAELKRRFMEEHYTNEFFVEEVNVETEIERLQKENEQMREVLTSIAFFDEPLADTYGYWATRTELRKLMETLATDTYIARECLAKLGEK